MSQHSGMDLIKISISLIAIVPRNTRITQKTSIRSQLWGFLEETVIVERDSGLYPLSALPRAEGMPVTH
jgi:hypothetical protein